MRIWFQIVSSAGARSAHFKVLQEICDSAASPGTVVELHGTDTGPIGDELQFIYHYDVRSIIENALRIRKAGGYDAFVIANSLDGGLIEAREILDIPVLSFMETACLNASTMGERVGLISPYARLMPRYQSIMRNYLLPHKMASVEDFVPEEIPGGLTKLFSDRDAAESGIEHAYRAARKSMDKGADVIIPAGPITSLLVSHKIFQYEGAMLLDCYRLLVKAAELAVSMQALTGASVSRRLLYQRPSVETLNRIAEARGIELLKG